MTDWNQNYLQPALSKAKTLVPESSSNTASPQRKFQASKTPCPKCNQPLSKIPSTKVKKKYFLKCTSGCENVVLFWNDFQKTWQPPRSKDDKTQSQKPPTVLTNHPCPMCKKALEEYSYVREGQTKKMLRCSDPKSRQDKKHKDVAYFQTKNGWWSPKFGNLT